MHAPRGMMRPMPRSPALALLLLATAACSSTTDPATGDTGGDTAGDTAGGPWDRGDNPHGQDDLLRLNHVQVKGTHNSTHLQPDTVWDDSHRYSHPTLTEQLERDAVRQFELDVHLAEDGSWEVFHLPVIDEETTCRKLADCLGELKTWSDANGWHLPLVVWIEPKDEIDEAADGYQLIGDRLLELDAAIRAVWPDDRTFSPDDLRGEHATLPEALAADGWPLLAQVRGQAMFALLDSGAHRATYLDGAPALQGRLLFVDTQDPQEASAALIKDGSATQITDWATGGLLVTTNGSSATDSDETAQAADQQALEAGVHHLATDMSGPTDEGGYWLDLAPRCNPVTAPAACLDAEVERL